MEYVRLLLLLMHALILEKRHDEASSILHETMAHIIIGDSRMGAALCVAGVKLNLMREDPSEALYMLRPLVSRYSSTHSTINRQHTLTLLQLQGQEIQQSEWPSWGRRWDMMCHIMNKFREVGNDNSITPEEKVFIQRRIVSCEENNAEIPWPLQMTRANLVVLKFVHIAFAEYADMLKRWDDDLYIDEDNEKYNERKAVTYLSMASKLCNCLNMKRTYHGSALLKALSLMRLYQEKREKHCPSEVLYNFGRIAQYAGLVDLAVTYYRDCLRLSDEDSDDVQKLTKKHAAFNLHLIYRDVGENELAMKLINNYLSI